MVWSAEEFSEKETPSCQDASVGMNKATLYTEGYITEGLAVDKKIEVVQRKGSQGVFKGHGDRFLGLIDNYIYIYIYIPLYVFLVVI